MEKFLFLNGFIISCNSTQKSLHAFLMLEKVYLLIKHVHKFSVRAIGWTVFNLN